MTAVLASLPLPSGLLICIACTHTIITVESQMVPMLSYVSNGIVCVQCRVVTLTPTNVVSMKHLSSFPVAKFTGMVQLAMW